MKKIIVCTIGCLLLITALAGAQENPRHRLLEERVSIGNNLYLATDVYLPQKGDTFPAILIRTPYPSSNLSFIGSGLARHGYAVVIQNVQGVGGSDGQFIPFINEHPDGMHLLEWVKQQSWFNGRIGLWGSSYLGFTALAMAVTGDDAIESMMHISGITDLKAAVSYGDAVTAMDIIAWGMINSGQAPDSREAWDEIFMMTPLRPAFGGIDQMIGILANSGMNLEPVDMPVLHITGWFDIYAEHSFYLRKQLMRHENSEQYLYIGPWWHNQWVEGNTSAGVLELPEKALLTIPDVVETSRQWFDATLKKPAQTVDWAPVRAFPVFGEAWHSFNNWPPEDARKTTLLLSAVDTQGNTMQERPAAGKPMVEYVYNPAEPVRTVAGRVYPAFDWIVGVRDRQAVQQRPDVITFTAQPSPGDVLIAGPVSLQLHVSSDAVTADFTAALSIRKKDGRALHIADGIQRVADADALKNGTTISIDLGNILARAEAGDRLVLEISSSNFPRFDRNPGTEESPLDATEFQTFRQRIHLGGTEKSSLQFYMLSEK